MVTSVTPTAKTMDEQVAELRQRRTQIELGGGVQRVAKHHAAHKLTARERIEGLVDHGSFQEIGAFIRHHCTMFGMEQKDLPADGVVTGCAKTWTHPALGTGDFVIMLFELAQRSVVSAAVHCDAAASGDKPQKNAIPVVVRIAQRGGGEVPPKHAAVIAMAATIAMVQKRPAASPAAPLRRKNAASWVLQGRTLIHASHNVAHRPMQSRFAGIAAQGREPKIVSEGSAK